MALSRYDNSASGTSALASSVSFSHTCSGNYLTVYTICNGNNLVSSITYNGVLLNNNNDQEFQNGYSAEIWSLESPFIGTASVVVQYGTSVADIVVISSSYKNVNFISGPSDNFLDGTSFGSGTTAGYTIPGTLSFSNDLASFAVGSLVTGTEPVGMAGSTRRLDVTGTLVRMDLFDYPNPTSNQTISATVGNGVWWMWCIPIVGNLFVMRLPLMGVG